MHWKRVLSVPFLILGFSQLSLAVPQFNASSYSYSIAFKQTLTQSFVALLSSQGTGGLVWNLDSQLAKPPAWLGIDLVQGAMSGTPTAGTDISSFSFGIQVSNVGDSEHKAEAIIKVQVLAPPVWAVPDVDLGVTYVGQKDWTFNLNTVVKDPANDKLTFAMAGTVPSWLVLDPSTGILSGIPAAKDTGNYSGILFTATGPGGSAQANGHGLVKNLLVLDPLIEGVYKVQLKCNETPVNPRCKYLEDQSIRMVVLAMNSPAAVYVDFTDENLGSNYYLMEATDIEGDIISGNSFAINSPAPRPSEFTFTFDPTKKIATGYIRDDEFHYDVQLTANQLVSTAPYYAMGNGLPSVSETQVVGDYSGTSCIGDTEVFIRKPITPTSPDLTLATLFTHFNLRENYPTSELISSARVINGYQEKDYDIGIGGKVVFAWGSDAAGHSTLTGMSFALDRGAYCTDWKLQTH